MHTSNATLSLLLATGLLLSGCLKQSEPSSTSGPATTPAAVTLPSNDGSTTSLPTVGPNGRITSVDVTDRDTRALGVSVVTFGQAFVAGHVPRGVVAVLGGEPIPTQVDVKRRHADGSVRHAVLSVAIPKTVSGARAELELRQASAMPSAGSGFTTASALSAGFDFVLEVTEGGTVYRASAADLLRTSASARWLDGGLATELRVRGPLKAAGTAHPVFEALFDIRFLSPTAARVAVVFENALAKPERGERTASFRILDAGGQVLFSQADVYVPQHARFRKVFDWGAARTTRVHVAPRLAYLIGTGALPRYDTTKTLDPQAVSDVEALVGLAEIFGNGPIQSYMPTTGGRSDLGVLPQWTAVALYTGDPGASDVMLMAGELAGSFPIHLRDPATGKPYSIDRNPTVSNGWWGNTYSTPSDHLPDCGSRCPAKDGLGDADSRRTNKASYDRIHQVDTAHQPSLAFVPYLLTGDAYFADELVFWASHNFLSMAPSYRQNARGLFYGEQTRGQAWSLRTLAQAAWITPESMAEERAYFEAKLSGNLDWYNSNATNSNPFGIWGEYTAVGLDGGRPQPDFAPNVRYAVAPWQIDYFIAALDYIGGLGYPAARPFRDWMAKFPVARFGGTDWPRADATLYQVATSWIPQGCGLLATPQTFDGCPSSFPMYGSYAEMVQATVARRAPGYADWYRAPSCAICYEANARPALAAAVRAGVPNARIAYDSLMNQINTAMASLGRDAYLRDPTWLIVP